MGFFGNVFHAVTAPVTSTVSAVQNLAHGNVGGALSATLQGTKDVVPPVGQYVKAVVYDAPKNFVGGGVSAVSGLVAGDWRRAGGGLVRGFVAPTPISTAEGAASNAFNDGNIISPTGYGAISYGDTSSDAYKRAAITTAAIGAGAFAGGAFAGGGADAAAGGVTDSAGASGASFFGTGITGSQAAGAVIAATGAIASANRKPAGLNATDASQVTGSTPLNPQEKLVLGGLGLAALYYIFRRT